MFYTSASEDESFNRTPLHLSSARTPHRVGGVKGRNPMAHRGSLTTSNNNSLQKYATYELVEREKHCRVAMDIEEDRERWKLHRHQLKLQEEVQRQGKLLKEYNNNNANSFSQKYTRSGSGVMVSSPLLPQTPQTRMTPKYYNDCSSASEGDPTPKRTTSLLMTSSEKKRNFVVQGIELENTPTPPASVEPSRAVPIVVQPTTMNVALGRHVVHRQGDVDVQAIVDGLKDTYWMSRPAKNQWIYVDLEDQYECITLRLLFDDRFYATSFRVEVSLDAKDWLCIRDRRGLKAPGEIGNRFWAEINLSSARGRYVRMWPTQTNNNQDCMKLHCLEVLVLTSSPEMPDTLLHNDEHMMMEMEEETVATVPANDGLSRSAVTINDHVYIQQFAKKVFGDISSATQFDIHHVNAVETLLNQLRGHLTAQNHFAAGIAITTEGKKDNTISPYAEEGQVMVTTIAAAPPAMKGSSSSFSKSNSFDVSSVLAPPSTLTTSSVQGQQLQHTSSFQNKQRREVVKRLAKPPVAPRNFAVGFEVSDDGNSSATSFKSGASREPNMLTEDTPARIVPRFLSLDNHEVTKPVPIDGPLRPQPSVVAPVVRRSGPIDLKGIVPNSLIWDT